MSDLDLYEDLEEIPSASTAVVCRSPLGWGARVGVGTKEEIDTSRFSRIRLDLELGLDSADTKVYHTFEDLTSHETTKFLRAYPFVTGVDENDEIRILSMLGSLQDTRILQEHHVDLTDCPTYDGAFVALTIDQRRLGSSKESRDFENTTSRQREEARPQYRGSPGWYNCLRCNDYVWEFFLGKPAPFGMNMDDHYHPQCETDQVMRPRSLTHEVGKCELVSHEYDGTENCRDLERRLTAVGSGTPHPRVQAILQMPEVIARAWILALDPAYEE